MKELIQALINQGIITATDIQRMTTLELLLTIIGRVNELHDLTKEALEAVQRLFDKGVRDEVVALLDEWKNDGTMAKIVNEQVFEELNNKIDDIRHICVKDFGAKGDGVTDDTDAIEQAIEQARNKTLFFPYGIYLVSRPLRICDASVKLDHATIRATKEMECLINFETDRTGIKSAKDLSRNLSLSGGVLDGGNLAENTLQMRLYLHFTFKDMTIKNGRKRAILNGEHNQMSAELIANNIYVTNEYPMAYAETIGIENRGGDNHWTDVIVLDYNVGIRDYRSNVWTRIHPWIFSKDRIPNSICFDMIYGQPQLNNCVVDSFQTGIKATDAYVIINNIKSYWEVAVYDNGQATNYPISFLDVQGNSTIYTTGTFTVNTGELTKEISFVKDAGAIEKLQIRGLRTIGDTSIKNVPNLVEVRVDKNDKFVKVYKVNGLTLVRGEATEVGGIFIGGDSVGINNSVSNKYLKLLDTGELTYDNHEFMYLYAGSNNANRPSTPKLGCYYFDQTRGIPLFWNGAGWVKADGNMPD